jgi:hypothetical protein
MDRRKRAFYLCIAGILLISFLIESYSVRAQEDFTHVIVNSEKWIDVYSTILYANILGKSSDFLVSERHATLLLNNIKKSNNIRVISSEDSPFILGYPTIILDRGFAGAEELTFRNINLELARLLDDIKNFIVIDDSYGYNAVAVAPYAVLKKSWVLFADRTNIAEIDSFLSGRDIDELLIYGYVDREVTSALRKYNPVIINTGDRFDDNIEIVKRYREINPIKQVVLTNGEFIEKEIMAGLEPVLFTGKENVPEQIKDYIKSTDIEVGVLIGNELVGAATNIRRTVGISVIVKFARGARAPTGPIARIEGLDLFYLPTPTLDLKLDSVKYNKATSQLEVTYRSNSDIVMYFKGTITITSENDESKKVGDVESVFIAPRDFKTVVYSDINLTGESFKASIFTIYGESRKALEKILEAEVNVDVIDIIDRCEIDVTRVTYHTAKKLFSIDVENIGEVRCYVDLELLDVLINDEKVTLGLEGTVTLLPKEKKDLKIRAELIDYDIEKNEFIDLIAYYGERENSLIKIFKGRYRLEIARIDVVFYMAIAIIIILAIGLVILIRKKRKSES